VRSRATDQQPATVPETATQAGPIDRWWWVEPSVWTERMLTALEKGVKGGMWFSLMDKVYSPKNLRSAWARVRQNAGAAGIDKQTIDLFEKNEEWELQQLHEQLREESYRPQPGRRTWIDKPGSTEKRPLGIPAVRDRVVQTALRHVLEPIWEAEFAETSYGFRPGRGCLNALRRVDELLKQGYTWVVDADLRKYFDTIPHDRLMEAVRQRIADGRVLDLIESYLQAGVMDREELQTSEQGSPQGAVISPLLANLYLNDLDHEAARQGLMMVRYADDFVILCRNQAEAERALAWVRERLEAKGLTLHPEKTRLVDATQKGGFDFLGYHFERGMHWPRRKSLEKLKERIREETPRKSGTSLLVIIARVNEVLIGWFGFFKHSYKTTFGPIDSWVRMRLRSILRKREGKKGRGRGTDHHRWTNRYFAEHGLFGLVEAHALQCQSLTSTH
jgi:RNA-directed DNA polymerase